MLKDAAVNAGAPDLAPGPWSRVSGMQAKLHRWAVADPGRRFGDLFNLVHDPATLSVAWDRVAGNTGARSAGVDGRTAAGVERDFGVQEFLDDLRCAVKAGTFRPMPARAVADRGGTNTENRRADGSFPPVPAAGLLIGP